MLVHSRVKTLQNLDHRGCSGHIGNVVGFNLRSQVGTQRLQCRAWNKHHSILIGKSDPTYCLPSQSLFLNDLAGAVMKCTVKPRRIHQSSWGGWAANMVKRSSVSSIN